RIEGVSPEESDAILEQLYELGERKENIYEHVWQLCDFLMWDNRATIHARTWFPPEETRLLRRCTVEGEPIQAEETEKEGTHGRSYQIAGPPAGLRQVHRRASGAVGARARYGAAHGTGEAADGESRHGAEPQGAFGLLALDRRPQESAALCRSRVRFLHQRRRARARPP